MSIPVVTNDNISKLTHRTHRALKNANAIGSIRVIWRSSQWLLTELPMWPRTLKCKPMVLAMRHPMFHLTRQCDIECHHAEAHASDCLWFQTSDGQQICKKPVVWEFDGEHQCFQENRSWICVFFCIGCRLCLLCLGGMGESKTVSWTHGRMQHWILIWVGVICGYFHQTFQHHSHPGALQWHTCSQIQGSHHRNSWWILHQPDSNLHRPQHGRIPLSSQILTYPQHKLQIIDQQHNPNQMVAAMVVALAEPWRGSCRRCPWSRSDLCTGPRVVQQLL